MAQFAVKELIARFLIDNPQITVLQQVTNENIDLIASGIDMAIRGHVDQLPDSTLIQRPLAVVEWKLFASPDYPINEIETPEDIINHQTLSLGWQAPGDRWRLVHKSGIKEAIQTVPRLKSDDTVTFKEAAGEGLGIVALPAYTCRDELASGKLVNVLPEWHAGQANLSLMMPRKSGFAASVVALQEFIQAKFADFVAMH